MAIGKINGNHEKLTFLSKNQYLYEVVKAHVDRFLKDDTKGRPEKVIEDIAKDISTDFHEVFKEFRNRESIYAFVDSQLKSLYDKTMSLPLTVRLRIYQKLKWTFNH